MVGWSVGARVFSLPRCLLGARARFGRDDEVNEINKLAPNRCSSGRVFVRPPRRCAPRAIVSELSSVGDED